MIYRLALLRKTPLLLIALLLAFPAHAAAPQKTGVMVEFTTPGLILPRREHEVLTLESSNVERLSAAIFHIPEGDTLRVLAHPDAAIPVEAQEVWHSQIDVRPNGAAPAPGQQVKSTLDVLQLVKTLQPGLYMATAHEVTTGTPRAEARKLFMISNIGLQGFAGADGIAVQARLLSEAVPAAGIDVALVAHNNREIARARTDNDGIAHFTQEQSAGQGDDAPAALYAYGADGEFTALPVSLPKNDPQSVVRAMIVTDQNSYKPGAEIHGLVLVRNADGSGAIGSPVYLQLENAGGNVAEFHTATPTDASGFGFTFHAPQAGEWAIRAYRNIDNHPVLLGDRAIAIGAEGITAAPLAAPQAADKTDAITIAPGRRSFQPGEMASVSVQSPQDSFVTVALVDRSVRAITRQKIGKDGAVVQLPVPADASGGMYVIATAFTAPTEAHDGAPATPIARAYGIQWIDIAQGEKRMSVRIDTPERAEVGAAFPAVITLQDLGDKTGKVQLVGSDASLPTALDPLAFFYGRRPLSVTVFDSYADVVGAAQSAVPDFAGADQASRHTSPALLWSKPVTASKNGKADFSEIFPQVDSTDKRLRLSAIAWSDEKLGYTEASVIAVDPASLGKKPAKPPAPVVIAPIHARATILKPGQSVTLKPHEAIVASIDPLIATPAAFDNNNPLFVTASMPQFRDYMQRLMTPAEDTSLLSDAILSLALPAQALDLPQVTRSRLLDAVQDRLAARDLDGDQELLAHYVLLKSGRETVLEVADWLTKAPAPISLPAKAARLALAIESPLFKTDIAPLKAGLDQAAKGDEGAVTLCLLAEAGQPWPTKLAHAVAAAPAAPLSSSDFAARVGEAAHLAFGDAKLKAAAGQTGNAIVSASALKVENADTRILHVLIVIGLPQ